MSGGQAGVRIWGMGRSIGGHSCYAASVLIVCLALLMCAAQAAQAYEFSPETKAACPGCTTPTGQVQAAELAEGLAINGSQSETFGSTTALAQDAAATSAAAAAGVGSVSVGLLLQMPVSQALWASPLWTGGLIVGSLATGYVVGTAGRAIVIHLFGGDDEPEGISNNQAWSDAKWRLCTYDPCGTTLSSSANGSPPAIPRYSVYATWQDRWSTSTNVSATSTSWLANCMWGCVQISDPGWGPQAGDLEASRAVTVYGVGTNERPGHIFTMSLADFLARGPGSSLIDASDATGSQWGAVGPGTFSDTQLLSNLDAVIAENPSFGAWVQSQLDGHPVMPDCTGLTVAACKALLPDGASVNVGNGDPTDADAVIIDQTVPPGTPQDEDSTVIVDTVAWTPTPPQPYPATYADEADVAAQRMKDNNPENSSSTEYDAAQTKVIAETCVWIAARLGTAKPSECGKRGLPIFVTAKQTPNLVSTAAATAHDIEAMTNPDFIKFLFQNYDQRAGRYKDAQSGWYSQLSNNPCAGLTGVGTGMDCDEFPFLATEQGGPWAWKTTGVHPSLKPVASGPNQAQGSKFGWFGTHCELSSGPERVAQELNAIGGQEFMFVPVDPEREVFTGYLCNPGAS